MRVLHFSPPTGIYYFQTDRLLTDRHSHPATEVVWSREKEFQLCLADGWLSTQFAVIHANQPHAIRYEQPETLEMILIEKPGRNVTAIVETIQKRLHLPPVDLAGSLPELCTCAPAPWLPQWDDRIGTCIATMEEQELTYRELLPALSACSHLSASRVSHVFRNLMGLTPRDYYQWVKLKRALQEYLYHDGNFSFAGLTAGFYDQPHFHRVYRRFMGHAPSKQYNSSIVQGGEEV